MLQSVVYFEAAFGISLNQIAFQASSQTLCALTTPLDVNFLHQLKNLPTVTIDCASNNEQESLKQLLWGVNNGCALFLVTPDCVFPFLGMFFPVHDEAIAKLFPKVMIVVDYHRNLSNDTIQSILGNEVVRTAIPQSLILQPNEFLENGEIDWINIWSAFPFSKARDVANKFFVKNGSLEVQKPFVSFIKDLDKIQVRQGVFDYPPFTKTMRVPSGSGNANIYSNPETFSAQLEGLESTIIVEFCRYYNCIVSARLDYDVSLWGWGNPNRTGTGILGAITKYDIDVTGCGCFIMGNRYNFLQYTGPIQQSMVTHFLPKPKILPFIYTPLLPFPTEMWAAVGIALLVGTFFVCFIFYGGIKTNLKGERRQNLVDSFFMVLQMNLFQQIRVRTKLWSKIVMVGTLLLSSFIIANLYTGGLSKIMTITPYESPIDSVEKLVETDLMWGETSDTWIMAIKESTYPPHQKYVQKFIEELDVKKIHNWVSEQKFAVIVNQMQYKTLVLFPVVDRNDSKSLMIMKKPFYFQYTALITTKTWPWIKQLNRIVFMQQESGIYTHWAFKAAVTTMDYAIQRNMEENSKKQENMEAEKLTVTHILGPLFLIVFGYVIAGVTFLIEILWAKHVREKIKKNFNKA